MIFIMKKTLLVLTLFLVSNYIAACNCMGIVHLDQLKYRVSSEQSFFFEGTIFDIKTDTVSEYITKIKVTFKISKIYKGLDDNLDEITIDYWQNTSCSVHPSSFSLGDKNFVTGYWHKQTGNKTITYEASYCDFLGTDKQFKGEEEEFKAYLERF